MMRRLPCFFAAVTAASVWLPLAGAAEHGSGAPVNGSPHRPAPGLRGQAVFLQAGAQDGRASQPEQAVGNLLTRWAKEVSPDHVLPEYPRPQMVRRAWTNLNGLWDYAIRPKDEARPDRFDGQILVPFPVQSQLSRVRKPVEPTQRLWYRRSFQADRPADDGRLLLHFGAVDWQAAVWVNGQKIGGHKGGYDPFTLDVTPALRPGGSQELVVGVWDPTDTWTQPRGKQVRQPGGIWYTAVTGIWQTVWLEPVAAGHIDDLKITPDIDQGNVTVAVESTLPRGTGKLTVSIRDGEQTLQTASRRLAGPKRGAALKTRLVLPVSDARLWSPSDPFLYDLHVTLQWEGRTIDEVASYFGMRKISLGKDEHGHMRLLLNNKPLFQLGPLDQGWWPDGLYTAPTDEALRYDIELAKRLGFNMIRKHVKVEPQRWYWWCDKLGMLVWQDMPSGMLRRGQANNLRVRADDAQDAPRDAESARQFETELAALIRSHYNHPSIVMWVPFNEGWGQYQTPRITRLIKQYDPTRLVDSASGWADRGVGDVYDIHNYPGPAFEPADPRRASVLGEFGGLGWPIQGHLWWNKRNWGYRTYASRAELNRHYRQLLDSLYGLVGRGLAAAVYTQTTDVEGEVNGLTTYDRAVIKIDPSMARSLAERLQAAPPEIVELLPDSRSSPQTWRLVRQRPPEQWTRLEFDDGQWDEVRGPLRAGANRFLPEGTAWGASEIWARKTFDVRRPVRSVWVQLYHDVSQLEIYLNGRRVLQLNRPRPTRRHSQQVFLSGDGALLHRGKNVVAFHATKAKGARAVDVALYAAEKQEEARNN